MPLQYMDCSVFCYNISRSLSFICVRELSHECSINFQVSVTSVNILSSFLLQIRFAYEKTGKFINSSSFICGPV